jgi:hypothetical protein
VQVTLNVLRPNLQPNLQYLDSKIGEFAVMHAEAANY